MNEVKCVYFFLSFLVVQDLRHFHLNFGIRITFGEGESHTWNHREMLFAPQKNNCGNDLD